MAHHKYRAQGMAPGDTYLSHGVNGHLYLRLVVAGVAQDRTLDHSDQCGCWREPWEYDPIDAY